MARVITFFPRESVAGGNTIYSEIFDLTGFSKVIAEMRIFTVSGGGTVTGVIEETSDPTFSSTWITATSLKSATVTGFKVPLSDPLRFMRASISVPNGTNAVVGLQADARGK